MGLLGPRCNHLGRAKGGPKKIRALGFERATFGCAFIRHTARPFVLGRSRWIWSFTWRFGHCGLNAYFGHLDVESNGKYQ